MSSNGEANNLEARQLVGAAKWVAIVAVAAWVGFSIYLLTQAGSSKEIEWSRVVWVFASVEAIAFAAAGALFGTSVQRSQTVNAEERAQKAELTASESSKEATAGRALAAAIQADEGSTSGADETHRRMGAEDEAEEDVRGRHANLARALFGEMVPRR
ncbi:hypothetical protein [Streptomyces chryseus]|uniref:hypothetical protein n=1 Tax=Streptomyces chryseus TaxID=68186 RepID=UPI00110F6ADF|nr:hypothetical protein [Streptomyces chryseus]GGX48561.1 hypothetical protein GCM10010353_73010 [Streptomyces chryseus]